MIDFYIAWDWLYNHPYYKHPEYGFSTFGESLDIDIVKVNPKTMSIDLGNPNNNTLTQVWLESGDTSYVGEPFNQYVPSHDYKLDCGGNTFEEAVIELYNLVRDNYGEYDE